MKVLTVLGARPQFIKAAPVTRALRATGIEEFLVHTGQHYDDSLSRVFFEELDLPSPQVNLNVGSCSHGRQTARMLEGLEEVMMREMPDLVLVYGDTNSTLAGALAACKLHFPLGHVEAGLRSFNRTMPEEHNRVLTDHCADLLFCPTRNAVDQLAREGIAEGVHLTGDTMYDALLAYSSECEPTNALAALELTPFEYVLATVHRPYNTDDPHQLQSIWTALADLGVPVVIPLHPRTRKKLEEFGIPAKPASILRVIEPVGYLDMLQLQRHARCIVTDSGGMQKEAFLLGIPCITLRPETEWRETVESGWNVLAGTDPVLIAELVHRHRWPSLPPPASFGDGNAAGKIVEVIGRIGRIGPIDSGSPS
jgi:UDP-N-acetylglucosamine 2-epimerase